MIERLAEEQKLRNPTIGKRIKACLYIPDLTKKGAAELLKKRREAFM